MSQHVPTLQTTAKLDAMAAEIQSYGRAIQALARVMRDNNTPTVDAPNEEVLERAVATIGRFARALNKAYRNQVTARPNEPDAPEKPDEKEGQTGKSRTRGKPAKAS